MKYYAVADVHGFYTKLKNALTEKGFFEDKEPRKLIVLGDLFDRGKEAALMQEFIFGLMQKDEVILVRGNHEDLIIELVDNFSKWMTPFITETHHWHNKTVDTVLQLTDFTLKEAFISPKKCAEKMKNTPLFKKIIPSMKNYFETENYVFTHGFIPVSKTIGRGTKSERFEYDKDWRTRRKKQWEEARWINGMFAADCGAGIKDKTIVCGHWHCSYGHAVLDNKGTEFGIDADFSPYYGKGVIAIDGCTAYSGKVNCIVINDGEYIKNE